MTASVLPDAGNILTHLIRRGLVVDAGDVTLTTLAGGVSNDVVAVSSPGLDVVVKQALGRLRVAEEWSADPARIETEGRALRLAGRLLPGSVPEVQDLSDGYLVIERAPRDWRPWKDDLLAGRVDVRTAGALGRALGLWQRDTTGDRDVLAEFADRTAFTQLRVDPFHRTVATRHPDLAEVVERTVTVMASDRRCLVHGDYTPKNVLVDPSGDGLWVIDWEVAHVGDPTFDPAWTVGHLLLKSAHRPRSAAEFAGAAAAFLSAFLDELPDPRRLDRDQLVRQTGCLLLARVDGKSPADYLTDGSRRAVRALGRRLLAEPPADILDAWETWS